MHSLQELEKTAMNPSDFRADLHCHTLCSDGSLTPEALIDLALEKKLQGLAITDHDTIEAYAKAVPYAKKKGLLLGTGVEFSCTYKEESVHVLGYDFCLEEPILHAYCHRQQQKRMVRNQEILQKLERLSIIVKEEELACLHPSASTLGRPHIAGVMLQKGYVQSIQEAFQRYLGDGGCCFVPGEPFAIEEASSIIRQAGGKVFLAHPHLYGDVLFVKQILTQGFDGIECYYGRAPLHKEKQWIKLARHGRFLISGGSDYHGAVKPHVSLGCSFVDKEHFFSIFTQNLSS